MTTRLAATVVRRPSLPLTERDVEDLRKLRGSKRQAEALSSISGTNVSDVTESVLLHALLEAGFQALRDAVNSSGYGDLAAQQDVESQRATARRRKPNWADE